MDNIDAQLLETYKNALKRMTFRAKYAAEESQSLLFRHHKNQNVDQIVQEQRAVAMLNYACTCMGSAYSIYFANENILAHYDIENVFHTFYRFADEMLTSYTTNHSHRHTEIYYDEFKEAFETSVLNEPCSD